MIMLTARTTIAGYVSALIYVYVILIFAYIVVNWVFALGVRVPYSRPLRAVIEFLRDVCEPYLNIFRRILPPMGGLDFSPVIALLVLYFVGGLIVNLIHG